jgi:hypothetical protein
MERPSGSVDVGTAERESNQQMPQTPSSIPLPPPSETPYASAPHTAGPSTPSIYPSLESLSAFAMPQTPTAQSYLTNSYQTPRDIPLPVGGDTPYGSGTYGLYTDPNEAEDVEMEDVSEFATDRQQESSEQSRSPAPHLLAMASAPVTPRNVPLPVGGQTPYNGMPATPVSAFGQTPESTSPQQEEPTLAMPETPRAIRPLDGQVSLRRRLLLRSAHKVMQEQASRRDMRRTMGVGSGLIGTPMRPQRGVDRSSMVLPISRPMSPITESAAKSEMPTTPSVNHESDQNAQMTPSRVALPSPGGTQYDPSFEEEDEEAPTDYAEPIKDHDEGEAGHVSLAMYQTDGGEEDEDEDAEGETDNEEEDTNGNDSSPVSSAMATDDGRAERGMYYDGMDGADAVQASLSMILRVRTTILTALQFPSPSASQTLFQAQTMDTVSDDDDLVDRSLDVGPDMEGASDDDEEGHEEDERSHETDERQSEVISVGSDEEEEDKENEPVSEDEIEQEDVREEAPNLSASPSRAVSALSFVRLHR